MKNVVVSFGEIMARLAAPQYLRLRQSREFEVTYSGAEASVGASVCNYGGNARYVTALSKHSLADAAVDSVRAFFAPIADLPAERARPLILKFCVNSAN